MFSIRTNVWIVAIITIAWLILWASVKSQTTQKSPVVDITDSTWRAITERTVSSNDDVAEKLVTRMLLERTGSEMSREAWEETKLLANAPNDGFGLMRVGGWKWTVAVLAVIEHNKHLEMQELRRENQELRTELNEVKSEVAALKALLTPPK